MTAGPAATAPRRATNRGAPADAPPPASPRRRRARWLRNLGTVLIAAGALLVVDAVLALVWREPITSFIAGRSQAGLRHDLARLNRRFPNVVSGVAMTPVVSERRRIALLAHQLRAEDSDGDAIGRITIPKLGASFVAVDGTDTGDLRTGPGFYRGQPLPGEELAGRPSRPVAIAGHRTTYLAPFKHVDELRRGDRITLAMPYAIVTYAVERTRIVAADDLSVLAASGAPRLVLTACHPLFSATHRIVVYARQRSVRPSPGVARAEAALGRSASLLKTRPPRGR